MLADDAFLVGLGRGKGRAEKQLLRLRALASANL